MSIYNIIFALVFISFVSAQDIPLITNVTRQLKGTDDIDVAPVVSDEQEEEDKVPETQEEAEARIIASAKEKGSKLPVSLKHFD